MKRPVLIMVLGYIIGIIIGLYCKISIAFFYICGFLIYLVLRKTIKQNFNTKLKKYYKLFDKKIVYVILVTSIISNTVVLILNNSYEHKYENIKEESFIAIVVSSPTKKKYYTQYKIKVTNINKDKRFSNTYLLLNTKDLGLEYGDKISFNGEYLKPSMQRNYKGFSYFNYLKSIGIYGTVKTNSVHVLGKQIINPIENFAIKIRDKMKDTIENNIEDEEKRNLLLGILLGDDDELSSRTREDFINSGLSHILAVSGMHISYVILIITCLFKKLPKKVSYVITILLLIFFIFLTEGTPSVKRAVVMAVVSICSNFFYRKSDTITNISLALLIILIQNPFSITNSGLILSFSATIGIIYLYPFLYNKKYDLEAKNKNNIIEKIKEIVILSISAQVFIFPISILLFNKISLMFLVSNLLISLFIGIIILLGFIGTLIKFKFIFIVLENLLGIVLCISKTISNIPISKIVLTTPSILLVIIYYIIIISFVSVVKIRKKFPRRRIEKNILTFVDEFKKVILNKKALIVVVLITIVLILILKLITSELKIHFIDVGQGDSTLIITPSKKAILIDGGGNLNKSEFDVAKNTLIPYLLDRKVKKIDYLIISHFDLDHSRLYA